MTKLTQKDFERRCDDVITASQKKISDFADSLKGVAPLHELEWSASIFGCAATVALYRELRKWEIEKVTPEEILAHYTSALVAKARSIDGSSLSTARLAKIALIEAMSVFLDSGHFSLLR
jgi:hypothetical protein